MAILWLRKSSEQDRGRKGAVRSCGHYSNWRCRLYAREAQQKQQAAEGERARATRRVCGAGAGGEEERAAHTYSTLSEIPVVRKRAVVRLREVRRLATSRFIACNGTRSGPADHLDDKSYFTISRKPKSLTLAAMQWRRNIDVSPSVV